VRRVSWPCVSAGIVHAVWGSVIVPLLQTDVHLNTGGQDSGRQALRPAWTLDLQVE
jgi:hypothetical protein